MDILKQLEEGNSGRNGAFTGRESIEGDSYM